MTVWFNDPMELFKSSKVLQFWPTNKQDPDERINASTRFILYASVILYSLRRDIRLFILAAMVLSVLYIFYKKDIISGADKEAPFFSGRDDYVPDCQLPSRENPMANVLLTDYVDQPNRPPACYYPTVKGEVKSLLDDTIQYDAGRSRSPLPKFQQRAAARQFISAPVSTIPGAQTDFAEWCYGKKFRPLCRDDSSKCDPDFRGAQLEAFAGLDANGDKRSGMFGGTV